MTPEQWQRVETLFAAIQVIPRSEHEPFLDQACRHEPEIRAELQSLLESSAESEDFLEQAAIRYLGFDRIIDPGLGESATSLSNQGRTYINDPTLAHRAALSFYKEGLSGHTLRQYELIAPLGRGGMGVVYKARDNLLGRLVAVKLLAGGKITRDEQKLRLIQEARAASLLNHPNIVTIYQVEVTPSGMPYIVMEYVEGQSLRDLLAERKRLELTSVLTIALQIAEGLSVAHERGIIHRDLKPENVVVNRKGTAKILDFGIAKLTSSPTLVAENKALDESIAFETAAVVTRSGMILGTAKYMSPEQATGKTVDSRTDQFSLGVMLFEMLTSRRPLHDRNIDDRQAAFCASRISESEFLNLQVPARLKSILKRCLAEDPADRYGSTHELAQQLRLVRDQVAGVPRKRSSVLLLLVAALITAALIEVSILTSSRNPVPAHGFYSAVPLTTYPGSELSPSFSPDGRRLAFAWNGDKQDNFDIYVKQIGVAEPFRFTTDPRPEFSPAWSPDGNTIAFVRLLSREKGEVLLYPSSGGSPFRRLTEIAAPGSSYEVLRILTWSPDSKWLVISDANSPNSGGGLTGAPRGLYLVSVNTGERRKLTMPPSSYDDWDPTFSPNMRQLVFSRYSGRWASDLHMLSLSVDLHPQAEPRRLTFYNRRTGSPVWSPDGKWILFARHENTGTHGIWRMDASDPSKIEPLPLSADNSSTLTISATGDKLVYTRENSSANIWGLEIGNWLRRRKDRTIPKKWISSSGEQFNPQFSPDGRRIAFQSTRSGYMEIWLANPDGANARQLTDMRAAITGFLRWSPDGTKIVFHSRPKGVATLFIIDVRERHPQPLMNDANDSEAPSWSRDGHWIYFASRRTGAMQVWKVSSQGGIPIQVTTHGGWAPLESLDGKFLFYGKTGHGLWRIPAAGGDEQLVLPDLDGWGSAYAVGKRGIYFIGRLSQNAERTLAFLSFATGRVTSFARIAPPIHLGLTVSPDDSLLLYTQLDNAGSNLMIVDYFH